LDNAPKLFELHTVPFGVEHLLIHALKRCSCATTTTATLPHNAIFAPAYKQSHVTTLSPRAYTTASVVKRHKVAPPKTHAVKTARSHPALAQNKIVTPPPALKLLPLPAHDRPPRHLSFPPRRGARPLLVKLSGLGPIADTCSTIVLLPSCGARWSSVFRLDSSRL
jgi:hypothetical protein